MWPKMLLELLPHLTKLIPAAENFLSSRKETERAHAAALAALAGDLRGGLSKAAEDQAAFRRELQSHMALSAQIASDSARARTGIENLENRMAVLEKRLTNLSRVLSGIVGMLILLLILVALRELR